MRPEQLALKGFGVFRERTVIDFAGVELFALTGLTGAGKTTILDGICFALYGSVPRHGKGAVAPVVTQGALEANVSLVFGVGEGLYQVARRVKKDARGKGANTDEASLERVERSGVTEVVASGAGPVTDKVKELLGLDFEQFTTCVLLPQGEFARFLHDKPSGRQELLTALLDLGVYERIGQKALERQRQAEGQLAVISQRLDELGAVTEEDLGAVRLREGTMAELLEWLEGCGPELQALEREAAELQAEMARQTAMIASLEEVQAPDNLATLGESGEKLRADLEAVKAQLAACQQRFTDLNERGSGHPSPALLAQWIATRRAAAVTEAELVPARTLVEQEQRALDAGSAEVVIARRRLMEAADADRAAHLRRGLKIGDPCPVCGQLLTEVLLETELAGTEQFEAAVEAAESAVVKLRRSLAEASSRADKLAARMSELTRQLEGVAELSQLEEMALVVASHQDEVEACRQELASLTARHQQLDQERARLVEVESRWREDLHAVWARLIQAGLDVPAGRFDQVVVGWRELGEWAGGEKLRLADGLEKTATLLTEVSQRRQATVDQMALRLADVDLVPAANPRDAVVEALASLRARRQMMEEAREEAQVKAAERETVAGRQQLARFLNQELRADRFKKWLFDEVFTSLVAGANDRLADLTRGQYELVMEGRDFEVIDNLSAGQRRSVKTLSGGETFLVSLALALSLADQVAEAATTEAAGKLDSFFLDEGFGALDAESMDVVAGVISELGASGKTVGIVTHITELAEQMPVRYRVEKRPTGAAVEVERE